MFASTDPGVFSEASPILRQADSAAPEPRTETCPAGEAVCVRPVFNDVLVTSCAWFIGVAGFCVLALGDSC